MFRYARVSNQCWENPATGAQAERGFVEKPAVKRRSAVRRDMFYSKIYLPTRQAPLGAAGKGGLFPCRSYGAWIDLLSQVYKQVAPNGAFNPLLCWFGFSTEPLKD